MAKFGDLPNNHAMLPHFQMNTWVTPTDVINNGASLDYDLALWTMPWPGNLTVIVTVGIQWLNWQQIVLSQSPAAVNPAGATDQFPTLDQGNPNRFVTQQLMLHWTAQAEGLQITPKIRVTVGTGGPNCTMDNIAALYLGHRT
jgi:hypothetical protein